MAAYCTIADLQKMLPDDVLVGLSDDDDVDAIDTTRTQEAIDSGAEEIDAFIGAVVDLPISGDVPPILGKLNVDIAIYNIYSRLHEIIPDTRQKRYDNAMRTLNQIATGKISFGLTPPPDKSSESGVSMVASSRTPIFSSDKMGTF